MRAEALGLATNGRVRFRRARVGVFPASAKYVLNTRLLPCVNKQVP